MELFVGERIVGLRDVDLAPWLANACHVVGHACRLLHVAWIGEVARCPVGGVEAPSDALDPYGLVGEALGDVAGGLFAAWGTMVALFDRSRTGKGQHVDVALFDSLTAMMPLLACRTLMGGEAPTRTGNRHSLSAPFGTYPASDGHFAVAVLNDRLFATFCEVIEQPELAGDARFASDSLRRKNEPALAERIDSWAGGRTVKQIVASLSQAGIPASEIQSIAQAWASTQAVERGLASEVTHPVLGPLNVPEQPVHFGDAPRGGRMAAPGLNADAGEILARLDKGMTQ